MEWNKTSTYLFDDILKYKLIYVTCRAVNLHHVIHRSNVVFAVLPDGSLFDCNGTLIEPYISKEVFINLNKEYYFLKDIIAWVFIDKNLFVDDLYVNDGQKCYSTSNPYNRKKIKYKGRVIHKDGNRLNCAADNLYIEN